MVPSWCMHSLCAALVSRGTGRTLLSSRSPQSGTILSNNEEMLGRLLSNIEQRLHSVELTLPTVPGPAEAVPETTEGEFGTLEALEDPFMPASVTINTHRSTGSGSSTRRSRRDAAKKKKPQLEVPLQDQYGVPIRMLRRRKGKDLVPPRITYNEKQDRDDVEIATFLDGHRRKVHRVQSSIRIQSIWRMVRARRRFMKHRERIWGIIGQHFFCWRQSFLADKMYLTALRRKVLRDLREFAVEQIRIREGTSVLVCQRLKRAESMTGFLWNDLLWVDSLVEGLPEERDERDALRTGHQPLLPGGQWADPMTGVHGVLVRRLELLAACCLSVRQNKNPRKQPLDDTWMCGVMRNIMKVMLKHWVLEVRRLKANRLSASLRLVKAWRMGSVHENKWLLEKIFLLFHIWRRMVVFKRALAQGVRPLPSFQEPHLTEWDDWVFRDTRERVILAKLHVLGRHMMERWMIIRWRVFLHYRKTKHSRYRWAREHYKATLQRQVLLAWDGCARERGRLLRSRIKYLSAWKGWAPKHRRVKKAKALAMERVRLIRTDSLLRRWQNQILALHQLRAYRIEQLTQRYRQPMFMAVGFTLSRLRPQFLQLSCWREWRLLAVRSRRWRRFTFLQRKMFSEHLMRTVLRGWSMVSGKKSKEVERLSLEPVAAMERCLGLELKMDRGFIPENILTNLELARLLAPTLVTGDAATDARRGIPSPQVDELCEAIAENDEDRVGKLLAAGVPIEGVMTDGSERTPLHVAACQASPHYLRIIGILLGCGASVSSRNKQGRTPLEVATDPRTAALLHAHRNRLVAAGYTKEERRRCVDVLNELWSDMTTHSLWKFVTYALIRHHLREINKRVAECKIPEALLQREWAQYQKFRNTAGFGLEPDIDDGDISADDPTATVEAAVVMDAMATKAPSAFEALNSFAGEAISVSFGSPTAELGGTGTMRGGISAPLARPFGGTFPFANHHMAATFIELKDTAYGTGDDDPMLSMERRDKLWALFPKFETSERFSHVLTLLERTQLSSDKAFLLDPKLLQDLGMDLQRGEVDNTVYRTVFKPDTFLIDTEPLSKEERRGGTRRGKAARATGTMTMTGDGEDKPEVSDNSLYGRSDAWYKDWCQANRSILASMMPPPGEGATDETNRMKTLTACLQFMEMKIKWVLEERRSLLRRDKSLINRGGKRNVVVQYEARAPFDGLFPNSTSAFPPGTFDAFLSPLAVMSTSQKPLTIDVTPYSHKRTYPLSVLMRPTRG
jgi:hypothetical protein